MPAETTAIDRLLAALKAECERLAKEGRLPTWEELALMWERLRK